MSEHTDGAWSPNFNHWLGIKWGVATLLIYVSLAWLGDFLLNDTRLDGVPVAGMGVFAALINCATCGILFEGLPPRKLRFVHWMMVVVVAVVLSYVLVLLSPNLFGLAEAFAGAFTLAGLPLGYVALKGWVNRSPAPRSHPDTIA